uniref:Tyrosine N-monooxygenase n=1 Tax=Aegilops tauschii TaxID=37682 RepID=M8BTB5_AEGTA
MSRLHEAVIEERWGQWKYGERKELDDFLEVLITLKDAEGKPLLTIEEIKAQSQDITFAAVDNPSNAVEWALAEMANAPEVMAKAMEEMDRVHFGCTLLHLSTHVALADTNVAGYHIPKGSHVILSRTGLGKNPTIWDEPLCFMPERHINTTTDDVALTENELRCGRRGCVAASLGTAMCMMLFGRLLQGFTWSKPIGLAAIDLSESEHDVFLAKPLMMCAKPCLPVHLYHAGAI